MPDTNDDIVSYWADVRPSCVTITSAHQPTIETQLGDVSKRAETRLLTWFKNVIPGGTQLTPELFSSAISQGVRLFMEEWYDEARKHGIGDLIEVVLDSDRDIPILELRGFVRALPRTTIDRVLRSAAGQARGLHALLACEAKRRDGELDDYELTRDQSGRLVVSFIPHDEGRNPNRDAIVFTLREIFAG